MYVNSHFTHLFLTLLTTFPFFLVVTRYAALFAPQAKVKFLAAEALRGVGGMLVDAEGQRFADELGTRDYVTGKIWDLAKAPGGAAKKYPVRLILNGEASREIEWHCKHYVGRGLMKK